MRALGGSCVKIGQSSFGVITALLRVRGLNLEGRERVEPCAALLQRVACGHILFNQRAAKIFGFAFGALPCLLHFRGGAAGVLGGAAGLFLGKLFHRFMMAIIQVDYMHYDVRISALSYALAFAVTVVFALAANFSMRPKLDRVNMAESLKSVE